MYCKELGYEKSKIIDKAFKDNKSEVTFSNKQFNICSPSFNSGIIQSNCHKTLNGKDLNIISSLDLDIINSYIKEAEYIKELAEERIKELLPIEETYICHEHEYTNNRKKFITISIEKQYIQRDIYGDYEIIKEELIEEFNFRNIGQNREAIISKALELKNKYNITKGEI